MASPQHPAATMEKLPGDVLSKIFIRLLAKQLAQMRCVCKPWNALLSRSSFVKSHLHRSIHNNNNDEILLVFNGGFSSDSKLFTAHPSKSPDIELTDFIKLPVIPQSEDKRYKAIGSVNGLICFSYGSRNDYTVHIWNPSLSALLTLPPYSMMPSHGTHEPQIFLRFGFDPTTDDYKVIKLICLLKPPGNMDPHSLVAMISSLTTYVVEEWLQVEVYSMRKGLWEPITQRPPLHITLFFEQDEVCLDGHDGHLHWLGYIGEDKRVQRIVAFDLAAQTFREMLLPSDIQNLNVYRGWNKFGVLDGKLCVMSRLKDGEFEVWVMDEYGVNESWVKHYVLSQFSGNVTIPYGFTSRSEFLFEFNDSGQDPEYPFEYNDDGRLALYDPIASNRKIFKICSESDDTKFVEYVDSLVWVAPPKQCEMSSCSMSRLQI